MGRGRGLLLRAAQRKAAEEKAKEESKSGSKTPEFKPPQQGTPTAEDDAGAKATPAVGRGRAALLKMRAGKASMSVGAEVPKTPPLTEGPPISGQGRGRGLFGKVGLGQVVHDDAASFRSEEFETSSRIGEAEGGPKLHRPKQIDVDILTEKLKVFQTLLN